MLSLPVCIIYPQVRSDDIKSVVAKRMQASKANKVMASIMPEFATFQVRSHLSISSQIRLFRMLPALHRNCFHRAGAQLLGF